jgi:hypothetical protein
VFIPFQGQRVKIQGQLGTFLVVRVNWRTETVDLVWQARVLRMERDIPFGRIELAEGDDSEPA